MDRWVDYLAFALSGLPANATVGAAVAYTLGDLYASPALASSPRSTPEKREGTPPRARRAV